MVWMVDILPKVKWNPFHHCQRITGGEITDQTSEIIVSFKTNATSNCWPAIWLPSYAQNICSQGSSSNDLAESVHYMSPSCLEWPSRPHLWSSVRLSCSQRSSRVGKAKQRTWGRWMLLRDSAICCTIQTLLHCTIRLFFSSPSPALVVKIATF